MENSSTKTNSPASLSRSLPWIMWSCGAGFFFYQFIVRVSTGVIANDLMRDLSVDASILGFLSACFYVGYTTMQIPVGLILDRMGARLPLTIAALLCTMGCALFATSDNIVIIGIARALFGVGAAFGLISTIKIISMWFPKDKLGFMVGMTIFVGITGATFGGPPLAGLVQLIGWRNSIGLLGALGSLIVILSWTAVRDRQKSNLESTPEKPLPVLASLQAVLRRPQTYIFGLYGGLMYVPLSAYADMWGIPCIERVYNVSCVTASSAITMFYIGVGVGAPLAALLADFLKSHKKVMRVSAFISAINFALVLYLPGMGFSMTSFLLLIAGFFAGGQMLAYTSVTNLNNYNVLATANGTHNMMCMTSGIIVPPIVGQILDCTWSGTCQIDGTPFYTPENFLFALNVVPAALFAAGFLTFFMKETYPTSKSV